MYSTKGIVHQLACQTPHAYISDKARCSPFNIESWRNCFAESVRLLPPPTLVYDGWMDVQTCTQQPCALGNVRAWVSSVWRQCTEDFKFCLVCSKSPYMQSFVSKLCLLTLDTRRLVLKNRKFPKIHKFQSLFANY